MGLTFAQPWWLAVACLAVPLGVLGVRSFISMSRVRAWSAVLVRTALLLVLASMLAGAAGVRESDRIVVVAIVDVSDSARQLAARFGSLGGDEAGESVPYETAVHRFLETAAQTRQGGDALGVVLFDADSFAALSPTAGVLGPLSLDVAPRAGSDLASALQSAQALLPPSARQRLLVISDGNETGAGSREIAEQLAAAGVPVDVVPLRYDVSGEVLVEAVDLPPRAQEESTVDLRVQLRATGPAVGRLELRYRGRAIDLDPSEATGLPVRLVEGSNLITVPLELDTGAVHKIEAIFVPEGEVDDRIAVNNRGEAFTVTPGVGRTLLVDGVGHGTSGPLAASLRRAGRTLDIIPPSALPQDLLTLQSYDLVILENVAADEVPRARQTTIAEYVRTLGGGLVMVGGYDSFGAGGWNNTPLEEVLPIEMDLPEELIIPQAAIAFVIDKSGSMGSSVMGGARSQQELANESTALAIETLDPTDLVMVLAFDSGTDRVIPLGPNGDALQSAERVRRIGAGGGTNMYPALALAGRELAGVEAAVKHVIVLSDGQSQGMPQEGVTIAENLLANDITVSTIAVGDGADRGTLLQIATAGGGEYYDVVDPTQLPRIFIKEIRVVRKAMIREGVFTPALTGEPSALLGGIDRQPRPPLGGLVLTQDKGEAKVTTPIRTPDGEPVLAHWFVGRGRAAAWTSDASTWSNAWIDWPGYDSMWRAIADSVARPTDDTDLELTSEVRGDRLTVRLDASDRQGRPLDLLRVPTSVYTPSGERVDLELEQDGPGTYTASIDASEQGNYVVVSTPSRAGETLAAKVGGASRPLSPEYRDLTSDEGALTQLAARTGGRVLDLDDASAETLFERGELPPAVALQPLWPVLLGWAVVLLIADVATRRVAWDRWLTRETAAAFADQAVERAEAAAATLASVRAKKATRASEQARRAPSASAPIEPIPAPTSKIEPAPAEPGATPVNSDIEESEDGISGLLAAKRRAQRRYKQ
ncbi:MAG: FixH family protein [Planctomycetota bacterium]